MTDSPKYGEGGRAKATLRRFNSRKTAKGRICFKCSQDVAIEEYGANKSWCLPCVRVYQAKRMEKKRVKLW